MEQRITFGEWLPDQPGMTGALQNAKNVVAQSTGYGPLPDITDYSLAASENLNAVAAGKISLSTTLFAGGPTKLFKFDSNDRSLDDVSKTGGYTGSVPWKFTQFGKVLIAANGTEKLQAWTLGVSAAFADLDASAPNARFVTVVRDFVVAARGPSNTNRVYWSDINDETDWTSGPASQSDYQDIPDGGDIQGITGGEYGLILCERSISRMSYIGAPLFFQFDTISSTLGCYEPGSVAQYGPLTFFLSDDGFYMCNGQTVTPIGNEKVDRWFWNDVSPSNITQMSAAIDPLKKVVIWCYPNTSVGTSLLMYNWQIGRWTYGITTADYVASLSTAGVTLEGLDTYSASIDALDVSLDSRQWAGGRLLFGGVRDAKIVTFTGESSAAIIDTGDIGNGLQSVVRLARPVIDGGSSTVAIASRDLLSDIISFGTASSPDEDNRVSLRSSGRYHRLRFVPSGQWTTMAGTDIDIVPRGRR
jgi:hypothetical protein